MTDTRPLAELRAGADTRNALFHYQSAAELQDEAAIARETERARDDAPYVYLWTPPEGGEPITILSAAGARILAQEHGAIRHRQVASIEHRDGIAIMTTYPGQGVPLSCTYARLPGQSVPDSYRIITEMMNSRTGLSIQIEREEPALAPDREQRMMAPRPYFREIARSRAFRNGILALVPVADVEAFKRRWLAGARSVRITGEWTPERREAFRRLWSVAAGSPGFTFTAPPPQDQPHGPTGLPHDRFPDHPAAPEPQPAADKAAAPRRRRGAKATPTTPENAPEEAEAAEDEGTEPSPPAEPIAAAPPPSAEAEGFGGFE